MIHPRIAVRVSNGKLKCKSYVNKNYTTCDYWYKFGKFFELISNTNWIFFSLWIVYKTYIQPVFNAVFWFFCLPCNLFDFLFFGDLFHNIFIIFLLLKYNSNVLQKDERFLIFSIQKESFGGVLPRRCSKKFRNIHRKTSVLKSLFNKVASLQACNFIKTRLQHRCFPVNIAARTSILKNICERLLLSITLSKEVGHSKEVNHQALTAKSDNATKIGNFPGITWSFCRQNELT